jgi:hypothetical protein
MRACALDQDAVAAPVAAAVEVIHQQARTGVEEHEMFDNPDNNTAAPSVGLRVAKR